MRLNETELISTLAFKSIPDWEGPLLYKPPPKNGAGGFGGRSSSEYKLRWFRLANNFLFSWRTDVKRAPNFGLEPTSVLFLERSHVQQEGFAESVHAFSIIFQDENQSKKHMFLADTSRHVTQWISAIKKANYETLRTKLISLQIKLVNKTGRDPLKGTGLENNPVYCPKMLDVEDPVLPGSSPRPKPRKKDKNKSSFQSHVVERWEEGHYSYDDKVDDSNDQGMKASFQSHVQVPYS